MGLNPNKTETGEVIGEINMTPLIDVMLVLLIIFMVTSSLTLESGLDIDIPSTTSKTAAKDDNSILISLDKRGNISIQGKATTLSKLDSEIKKALKEEKASLVILEGDKKSTLDRAIQIMDIARGAGARQFAIAAETVKK